MSEIIISYIVGCLIAFLLLLTLKQKIKIKAILVAFLYSLFLITIAIINFELEIFEQKFASQFAFDIFLGQESLRNQSGFVLQYILNIPVFLITNAWWAAISTNVVLMSIIFWYVLSKKANNAIIIMFAPVIINFSMFSLRDPIIAVLLFAFTLFFIETKNRFTNIKLLTTSGLFLISRPELLVIALGSKATQSVLFIKNKKYLFIIIPIYLVIIFVSLSFVPKLLGLESSTSILDLPDLLLQFYESRALRWDSSDGGGSNILGGALVSYPFYIRYPIQVFTFFVLPLPFEVTKFSLALAFIDSIFFCWTTWKFHKHGNKQAKIIFWVYVLSMAFFSNNYGNVFRLRLPAYFIMLAGLIKK